MKREFKAIYGLSMTMLQQMHRERAEGRERLRLRVRERLRSVLNQIAPAKKVIVFGSLTRAGGFTEHSDIDLALEEEPADMSLYQLIGLMAERMERPVDVILLPECRFRERIAREGETWMLPG